MDDKVAERTNDATPEHGKHDDRPADRKKYLDQPSFRRNDLWGQATNRAFRRALR